MATKRTNLTSCQSNGDKNICKALSFKEDPKLFFKTQ